MRAMLPVLALLGLGMFVPVLVMAQPDPDEGDVVVTDPTGDVVFTANAVRNQSAPGGYEHVDLTRAWIGEETDDSFTIGMQFARFENPPLPGAAQRFIIARFDLGERSYALTTSTENFCKMRLRADYEKGSTVRCLEQDEDAASRTLRVAVPRNAVVDQDGTPAYRGTVLTNFSAQAHASQAIGFGVSMLTTLDRAPDTGPAADFVSQRTIDEGNGPFVLGSPQPVRVSNGESTTFAYQVDLQNNGNKDTLFQMSVEGTEDEFEVHVPAAVKASPGATIRFPAILTMGFEHRHSETRYFSVVARDTENHDVFARTQLGVYWVETPQPAGHHDRLWFHTAPAEPDVGGTNTLKPNLQAQRFWMNPLETDPDVSATDEDARGFGASGYAPNRINWQFPFSEELKIGLDFDLSRTGAFTTEIISAVSSSDASLNATLFLCDSLGRSGTIKSTACGPDGRLEALATGPATRIALAPNSPRQVDIVLTPLPEADLVPFRPGTTLLLDVALVSSTMIQSPDVEKPQVSLVTKNSLLQLPLIEYHDPVDQAFQEIDSLSLASEGASEKPVNPGEVARFVLVLGSATKSTIDLSLTGHNLEWLRISEETTSIGSGGEKRIIIDAEAPIEASPGERAEFFVIAQDHGNPNRIALTRLRATVVDPEAQDVPDARVANDDESVGTSSLGVVAAVACVAGAAWAARRP